MLFTLIEVPEIIWRNTSFKECMVLGHGWSLVGVVEGKNRFRMFWDTARHMTVVKDNCTGLVADIPDGRQLGAKQLAKRWLEESILPAKE